MEVSSIIMGPSSSEAHYGFTMGLHSVLPNLTGDFIMLLHNVWWDMEGLINCAECMSKVSVGGGAGEEEEVETSHLVPCGSER